MSTALVNHEILQFLSRKDPEVLCIKGKWGVGKTYTWMKRLEEAQAKKSIKLPRYSYVSLFGINSLDELKFAIFENVVTLADGNFKADLKTLDSFVNSNIGSWRKITKFAQSVPMIKSFIGTDTAALLSFLAIHDQIVCIDDLERRGQKLDVGDVLGLASFLKEQRACKVVLLLNDEQLKGEDKKKFDGYLEKVVDILLTYEPSAQESVAIALTAPDITSRRIADLCISLGISNIRIIDKIKRSIQGIQPLLKGFDEDVFNQAGSSLALFGWAHYQPGEAPTLEFLTTKKSENSVGPQQGEDVPANEAAWNALLDAYGYVMTDEFDLALIDGVRNGYFDPEKIGKYAKELHERIVATKADGSFGDAWRMFHDSFEGDQEVVLDTIYASFMKNFKYISPLNLSGTVRLFKDLGRTEQASEMIAHYVANRDEDKNFFDLDEHPFRSDIADPEIEKAFATKCTSLEETRDIPNLLLGLKDGLNNDAIAELSVISVDIYYQAFKQHSGKELRKMLSGCLQFDRIVNASSEMREISRRAKEALRQIGRESPLNALRVRRFGVSIDEPVAVQKALPAARFSNDRLASED